jgi:phosphomannomutase/phosphoglucomutase
LGIFKSCDVRGVVGAEWDAADACRIGRSLGHMVRQRGEETMVVGGDFRRSTPELKAALIEGLADAGVNVDDVGQLPTPVVYFAARQSECPNVAVVTASHNPGQYNGVKFQVAGRPAVPELIQELQQGLDQVTQPAEIGRVQSSRVSSRYEEWVVATSRTLRPVTSQAPPRTAPLRIVLDTMGGAFGDMAPRVLESAGHRVVALHHVIDPDFRSGPPNPADDVNLQAVISRVTQQNADLGIALDGDGDRVVFVDHRGRIARPEQIAALLVRDCFPQCTLVYDLKCASIVPRSVEAVGGVAIMQPSGYGFIKAKMIECQADLGVEVSGHHFYAALGGGDDGLFTALVLLGLLHAKGQSLAELRAPLGWPTITPDLRIPYHDDPTATLARIAASCGGTVSRLDGVRAEYEVGGWALARASITEPAITFRFEGVDRKQLRSIATRFLAAVPELCHQILERIDE